MKQKIYKTCIFKTEQEYKCISNVMPLSHNSLKNDKNKRERARERERGRQRDTRGGERRCASRGVRRLRRQTHTKRERERERERPTE